MNRVSISKQKYIWACGFVFLVFILLCIRSFSLSHYVFGMGTNIVVISGNKAVVFAFRPNSGLAWRIDIPDKLKVGSYPVENYIKELGRGGVEPQQFIKDLSASTGIMLPFFIRMNTMSDENIEVVYRGLMGITNMTNISWLDRGLLMLDLRSMFGKLNQIQLSIPTSAVDSEEEADGNKYLKPNGNMFNWTKNQLVFDSVLEEAAEIAVINSSGRDGQARVLAHVIDGVGMQSMLVLPSDFIYDGRCAYSTENGVGEKYGQTQKILTKYFGCRLDQNLKLKLSEQERVADLYFFIGKQY
jgi:hypothetical protein